MGYIYKTTNTINNKIYIGLSNQLSKKNCYMGSGKLLNVAFKEFGIEHFIKEILEDDIDKSILGDREKYWIKFYNSTDPAIGYNVTQGGQGFARLGVVVSEETKIKLSNSLRGKSKKPWSESRREKMKGKVEGDKNGMYGKKFNMSQEHKDNIKNGKAKSSYVFTAEHRANMSISQKGKTLKEETKQLMSKTRTGKYKNGEKIIQLNDSGEVINTFKSIAEVSRTFNIPRTTLGRMIDNTTTLHSELKFKRL